jgi:hypothetical protein
MPKIGVTEAISPADRNSAPASGDDTISKSGVRRETRAARSERAEIETPDFRVLSKLSCRSLNRFIIKAIATLFLGTNAKKAPGGEQSIG